MKLKSLFLTSLLSLLFISGAFAQDKYEYATVSYYMTVGSKSGKLAISKVATYEETDVKLEKGSIYYNNSPLLECVEKMSGEGWEVIAVNTNTVNGTIYHLRKKKN